MNDGLEDSRPSSGAVPALATRGADQAADQRVRGARRHAVVPGDQVPGDRADQRAEDHVLSTNAGSTMPLPMVAATSSSKNATREIEERRPEHGLRAQHAGRHDGGDGVRRVVKAVHEVEHQRERISSTSDMRLGEFHASESAASGVFEHDALDHVRDVLALVGRRFEHLVDG